jgi:hypothetical protein
VLLLLLERWYLLLGHFRGHASLSSLLFFSSAWR